jgi:hypothetical protein
MGGARTHTPLYKILPRRAEANGEPRGVVKRLPDALSLSIIVDEGVHTRHLGAKAMPQRKSRRAITAAEGSARVQAKINSSPSAASVEIPVARDALDARRLCV